MESLIDIFNPNGKLVSTVFLGNNHKLSVYILNLKKESSYNKRFITDITKDCLDLIRTAKNSLIMPGEIDNFNFMLEHCHYHLSIGNYLRYTADWS